MNHYFISKFTMFYSAHHDSNRPKAGHPKTNQCLEDSLVFFKHSNFADKQICDDSELRICHPMLKPSKSSSKRSDKHQFGHSKKGKGVLKPDKNCLQADVACGIHSKKIRNHFSGKCSTESKRENSRGDMMSNCPRSP